MMKTFTSARRGAAVCLCAAACLASPAALAADEEIQVYQDDLSEPGQFGLDLHMNYVLSGSRLADYAGQRPPRHVLRVTPEFYYGLTANVELGLYILTSRSAGGSVRVDGSKLRVKYIAPHDDKQGAFWGANLEVGRTSLAVSERPWNAQLKGIWGYRGGAWTLGANANADWSLSSGGGPAEFSLDLKAARSVAAGTQLGVELYGELGPLRRLQGWDRHAKVLYAVLDKEIGETDLNFGIGRALTREGDRWVLKLVVGTHF